MKKIILSAFMLIGLAFTHRHKKSKNAIGLRLETVEVSELKSLIKELWEVTID
jgi:hypothetical protein